MATSSFLLKDYHLVLWGHTDLQRLLYFFYLTGLYDSSLLLQLFHSDIKISSIMFGDKTMDIINPWIKSQHEKNCFDEKAFLNGSIKAYCPHILSRVWLRIIEVITSQLYLTALAGTACFDFFVFLLNFFVFGKFLDVKVWTVGLQLPTSKSAHVMRSRYRQKRFLKKNVLWRYSHVWIFQTVTIAA